MTAYMPITAETRSDAWVHPRVLVAAVLTIAALLLRQGQFGNPIAGLDEQFYLLVGDRMWHGAMPYIDIWDRKPIGLFLLFAAIRLLPGDGVLAAQLVATGFAAATAWYVALIARRAVAWPPATMAGIFYIAALNHLWGETTQSPVFYNLLIAAAALLTLRAVERSSGRVASEMLAMLLAGVAIQIKTNAVFEGAFFGGWLIWTHWSRTRDPIHVLRRALLLAAVGALPTVAVMLTYLSLGQFNFWWQANVLSVLAKGRPTDANATSTLALTVSLFGPVAVLSLLGFHRRTARFTRLRREDAFLVGWIAVAVIDFVSIGGYFPHYALPLVLACCPFIATAFALRHWGIGLFAASMIWPIAYAGLFAPSMGAAERANAATVLAALPADVRTQCLFIYEGPPIYYHLSHACATTRYMFPAHLGSLREAGALGVDPAAELRATLARRPGTVLTVAHSRWIDRNPSQDAMLMATLRRNYHRAATLPYVALPQHGELVMWRRNDLR